MYSLRTLFFPVFFKLLFISFFHTANSGANSITLLTASTVQLTSSRGEKKTILQWRGERSWIFSLWLWLWKKTATTM